MYIKNVKIFLKCFIRKMEIELKYEVLEYRYVLSATLETFIS